MRIKLHTTSLLIIIFRICEADPLRNNNFINTALIDETNVNELVEVWRLETGSVTGRINDKSIAIESHGVVFKIAGESLYALDLESQSIEWKRNVDGMSWGQQGLGVYETQTETLLIIPTNNGLMFVDAQSGELNTKYGSAGRFKHDPIIAPPLVHNDQIIFATVTGKIIRYSLEDNSVRWSRSFNGREFPLRFWQRISFSAATETILINTSNLGGIVDNGVRTNPDYGSSLIGLNFSDGTTTFSSQDVYNDVWDFDMAGPPIIFSNKSGSNNVVSLGKTGNVHYLDLATKEYIFDTPHYLEFTDDSGTSSIAKFDLPEALIDYNVSRSEIPTDSKCNLNNEEGIEFVFNKPRITSNLILRGVHGGPSWMGGTVDPEKGILYVPVNTIPYQMALDIKLKTDLSSAATAIDYSNTSFLDTCLECHRSDLGPQRESTSKPGHYTPSLLSATIKSQDHQSFEAYIRESHSCLGETHFERLHINYSKIADFLTLLNKNEELVEVKGGWSFLSDDNSGLPAVHGSWGEIVALDLNTGKIIWRVPNGYRPLENSVQDGDIQFGGLAVTSSGIIFSTGTPEEKLFAYSQNGDLLAEYQLPQSGTAPPQIFLNNECPYILVNSGPGKYWGYKSNSSETFLSVFSFPSCTYQYSEK